MSFVVRGHCKLFFLSFFSPKTFSFPKRKVSLKVSSYEENLLLHRHCRLNFLFFYLQGKSLSKYSGVWVVSIPQEV